MKNKKGFLLIEFLISLAIFIIFFTAISKLQILSICLKDFAAKKIEMLDYVIVYIESNKKEKKISVCNQLSNISRNYSIQDKDLLILQKFKFKFITVSSKTLINKKMGQNCSIKLVNGEEFV
ncbi:prepilin-type N-terminal cleavage/methylation domain-containing protein [Candidatus Babeliales bacterium]|nr:prepilin-type N-terminal cleavage/methylation domain-containing protein [Candidatus Babeliales bacterium]